MSAGDAFDLLAFLKGQWHFEEMLAREVSRPHGSAEGVPVPEHWEWVCDECDTPIEVDSARGPDGVVCEALACQERITTVSLRSVEEYPYSYIGGEGPNIHVTPDDEVPHLLATYLMTYDPARVVADITAKRGMVIEILNTAATIDGEWGCVHEVDELEEHCTNVATMTFLESVLTPWAQAYRDRSGFRQEWLIHE